MKPASIAGHVLELVVQTEREPGPPDRLAASFFRHRRYLGSRERRVISDLFFGFIRHRRRTEALFEEFLHSHPGMERCDAHPARFVPLLLIHIALARDIVQESFSDPPNLRPFWTAHFPDIDFPPLASWSVAHQSLGFLREEPAVMLAVRHSFQDWMVEEWAGRWGDRTESLLDALNQTAPVVLRVNSLKTGRLACRERLAGEGISSEEVDFPSSALVLEKRFAQHASGAFRDGWFEVQDLASQIVSLVCAPHPGGYVIDGCAGAGGKSLHLAALMGNRGTIVAVDSDDRRLAQLSARIDRSGATVIGPVLRKDFRDGDHLDRADVVLVDAPCSGTGTIRRNPMLKWKIGEEDIGRFHERQLDLLNFYAGTVKPGGRLIYSTCSLMRGENEEVVGAFLRSDNRFHPDPIIFEGPVNGHREEGGNLRAGESPVTVVPEGHLLGLWPHIHNTDGFFIARLRRSD